MRKLLHYFVPVMLAALAPVYADAGVPLHESAARGVAGLPGGLRTTGELNLTGESAPAAPVVAAPELPATVIYGQVTNNRSMTAVPGIYSYSVSDNTFTPLLVDADYGVSNSNGGVYATDGYYYAVKSGWVSSSIKKYDCADWSAGAVATVNIDGELGSVDLTFDPVSKTCFGIFNNDNEYSFGKLDLSTGAVTRISVLPGQAYVIAADAEGTIWMVAMDPSLGNYYYPYLFKVDKTTGARTSVGNMGYIRWGDAPSATFDFDSGTLFATTNYFGHEKLWIIDTSTAVASEARAFPAGENMCNLFVPYTVTPDEAPALLADFDVTFTDAQGNARVTFTIPALTHAGVALPGNVDYTVTAGGVLLASGSAAAGSVVDKTVNIAAPGAVTVEAALSCAGGPASVNRLATWSGPDTPAVPAAVTAVAKGNDVTVSWTPGPKGANGGFVDAAAVTYKVVLQPGDIEVAAAATGVQIAHTLSLTQPASLYAEVTASAAGLQGATAVSERFIAGPAFGIPYSEKFATADAVALYTIEDSNNDKATWEYYDGYSEQYMQCTYTPFDPKDDWLFTPRVHLESEMQYTLSFSASARKVLYPEMLEVRLGKEPVSTAMTQTVLEPEKVLNEQSYQWFEYTVKLTVEETGDYNIGFHAMSEADMELLAIDNIRIDGALLGAPAPTDDLEVVPAPWGLNSATVRFSAPVALLDGTPSRELLKAEVFLNHKLFKTIENPEAGAAYTVLLENTEVGENIVEVYFSNATGRSPGAEVTVFTGPDAPAAPANITATPVAQGILVSWEHSLGANGGYVDPENMTYIVARHVNGSSDVIEVTGKTSFIDDTFSSDYQVSVNYMVQASNDQGSAGAGISNALVLGGSPYQLPFSESFADGMTDYGQLWNVASVSGGRSMWSLWDDIYFGSYSPVDDDMGAVIFVPDKKDDVARIYSGCIDLTPSKHPVLEFWTMARNSTHTLTVEACGNDGRWIELQTIDMTGAGNDWQQVKVPLDRFNYLDRVQIAFKAKAGDISSVLLVDKISVRQVFTHDLEASINVPSLGYEGQPLRIAATVTNRGENPAGSFTLEIYRGEALLKSEEFCGLDIDESVDMACEETVGLGHEPSTVYTATVKYSADKNPENDNASKVTRNNLPLYPVPTGLHVTSLGNESCNLAWSAPLIPDQPAQIPVTDDFESYEPFIIDNIGDWSVIDNEGEEGTFPILGMYYPHSGEPKAWQVFNLWALGIEMGEDDVTWRPSSGHQFLVSFADRDRINDDWLISPVLSGHAQTISFMARSLNSFTYGDECYQVMVSKKSPHPSDFEFFDGGTVPGEWTEFKFELPEGARYFAIRCTSVDQFAMGIDDITYIPGNGIPDDIELQGYHLYCNGKRVTETPVATPEAGVACRPTDSLAVSAVYNCGESRLSESIVPALGGISGVALPGNISANGVAGGVVVEGLEGVRVELFSIDGRLVGVADGQDSAFIPCAPGIYVLRAGQAAAKVKVD